MAQKKSASVKAAARGKTTTTEEKKKSAAAAKKPAAKSATKPAARAKTAGAAKKSPGALKTAKTATAKAAPKKVAAKKAAPSSKSAAASAANKTAAKKAATAKAAPTASRSTAPRSASAANRSPAAARTSTSARGGPNGTAAKRAPVKSVAAAAPKPAMKRQQPRGGSGGNEHEIVAPVAPKSQGPKHAGFKTGEYIVYPAHGVGQIVAIEEQEIAGMSLELFVITFEKDKMTLRVPTAKLESVGMRKLAPDNTLEKAMTTLKGRARVKRTMWSRRAQEYEAKINSGDLVAIAEVVRDLYRSDTQPEQSYSERQLYEAALDRMARELAAVENLDERGAVQRITDVLAKSAKGRRIAEEEAAQDAETEGSDSKAA